MQQEYFFILLFSLLAFRMLVIVFHEFGHAFSSLLNSDGKVSVYIGSLGNPEKSFRFQIKRLECFIKYNIFKWRGGLCVSHGENISWKGRFLISLFGPLTTLLLGIISILFLLFVQKHILFLLLFAFAFSCIVDFIYNIVPRRTQIKLHDGTLTNNDGKQLLFLWNIRKVYDIHNKAFKHYTEKEFAEAGELFEKCIDSVSKDREIYRLAISSHLMAKEINKAFDLEERYSQKYNDKYDHFDFTNSGVIEVYKGNYANALDLFEKALELDDEQIVYLNNVGHALGVLNRHEEAIVYLDKAILLEENFTYALDNRGYSKIMLGQLDEGYADLQKSLEIDDQSSYVLRNLGVYHFQKNEYYKALEFYQKAFELDPKTLQVQDFIDEVKKHL